MRTKPRPKRNQLGRPLKANTKTPREQLELARVRYQLATSKMIRYLGGYCHSCGLTNEACLDIYGQKLQLDHRDPSTKEYEVKERWGRAFDNLKDELDKCQLLCPTCHTVKTHEVVG